MNSDKPRRKPWRAVLAILAVAFLGTLAAPAAWGEANGPGTQGKSESNPDGEGVDKPYAAAGQAAMSQGDSDWDGNNGCGNDDDRADDNNGNCGGGNANDRVGGAEQTDDDADGDDKAKADDQDKADDADDDADDADDADADDDDADDADDADDDAAATGGSASADSARSEASVMGLQVEREVAPAPAGAGSAASETRVLGLSVERGQAAALAATGAGVAFLIALAMGLIGTGSVARRLGRR